MIFFLYLDDRQLDVYIKFLNAINKNIQSTLEKEKAKVLNFMDLFMLVKNNKTNRKPAQ